MSSILTRHSKGLLYAKDPPRAFIRPKIFESSSNHIISPKDLICIDLLDFLLSIEELLPPECLSKVFYQRMEDPSPIFQFPFPFRTTVPHIFLHNEQQIIIILKKKTNPGKKILNSQNSRKKIGAFLYYLGFVLDELLGI